MIQRMMKLSQEFTSKNTSVNRTKVPAIFKKLSWKSGQLNLDLGGGKFDSAQIYIGQFSAINRIYDPYNQSAEQNQLALEKFDYDTVTISNVLNVIQEEFNWQPLIQLGLEHLKLSGLLYITVYEGDGSGVGRVSKPDCWQHNKKLGYYFSVIQKMKFTCQIKAEMNKGMIILTKLN